MGVANSTTVTKGNAMVDNGSGFLTNGSSGGNNDIHYVAMETVVTTADGQFVLMVRTQGVNFEADTTTAPAQTDVGTVCDLAGAGTLDQTATTDNIFYIESIKGATADKKVIGHFSLGTPNS